MSKNDSKTARIKILPDGKIMVERHENRLNEKVFDLLSSSVKNTKKLENFLFQWPDRKVFLGNFDLCG